MFYLLISIAILCLIILLATRIIAIKIELVDKPNHRKKHSGHVPLVGGIAIYFSICLMYLLIPNLPPHSASYLISISLLLTAGVLDDRFDLPVLPRVAIQALAAVLLMYDGAYLYTLGNLWFGNALILGSLGYLVTLFAMWSAINAFNMVDGLDGLLGILACISLAAIAFCFYLGGQQQNTLWTLGLLAAIVPYLMLNLEFPFGSRFKVFMGDAGSTLLGFTILWLLLVATQGQNAVIAPATALWLIALPLMDMVMVMIRRIHRGYSPFKPDREHLHHILMRRGLSSGQTVITMAIAALLIAALGIVFEAFKIKELLSVTLFITLFAVYCYTLNRINQACDLSPLETGSQDSVNVRTHNKKR